ncbi:TPA: helix-turn-helix transcriptional regulator [Bacillus paranthracis]
MTRRFTIKQARMLSGLKQVEIAKEIGVSREAYLNYEQYKTFFRIDKAFKFAEVVNIPLDDIIFFDDKLHLKCS